MSTKKAFIWMMFWMLLAGIFNVFIYFNMGEKQALEFLGGYIIELSLSVDNLFLFLLIFRSFGINDKFQRRVLNFGIAGAIVLRLIFVILGVAVVTRFESILYLFGIILIISGFKMFKSEEEETDFKNSKILKFMKKIIPFTDKLEGEKFFVKTNKVLYATPLFAILVIVEASDVIFAIDSIPAIFSITTDPLIVYTSNIFAILGLRNMYFLLQKLNQLFVYVKHGVAIILVFTGIKLITPLIPEVVHLMNLSFPGVESLRHGIPIVTSIIIIISILFLSVLASMLFKPKFKN